MVMIDLHLDVNVKRVLTDDDYLDELEVIIKKKLRKKLGEKAFTEKGKKLIERLTLKTLKDIQLTAMKDQFQGILEDDTEDEVLEFIMQPLRGINRGALPFGKFAFESVEILLNSYNKHYDKDLSIVYKDGKLILAKADLSTKVQEKSFTDELFEELLNDPTLESKKKHILNLKEVLNGIENDVANGDPLAVTKMKAIHDTFLMKKDGDCECDICKDKEKH